MNWFLTVVVKAALEWLLSLLVRLKEREKIKQEGREEVKDALEQKQKEVAEAIEELRNSDPSFDAAIRELRERSPDNNGGTDNVSGNNAGTSGSSK